MYQTNLKAQVINMKVGDILQPKKGYGEITLRNYASQIGKAMGRKYSVQKGLRSFTITRVS